jgi:hypothetical protein
MISAPVVMTGRSSRRYTISVVWWRARLAGRSRAPKLRCALAAKDTGHACLVDRTWSRSTRWPPADVLLWQAPPPRREPAGGHPCAGRRDRMSVGPLPGAGARPDRGLDLGIVRELATAGLVVLADKGHANRGSCPYSVLEPEQARLAEGRQPRPRPATVSRRAGQCPAQELVHPAQAPLLPLARGSWPRPSTSFKPARLPEEKGLTQPSRCNQWDCLFCPILRLWLPAASPASCGLGRTHCRWPQWQ